MNRERRRSYRASQWQRARFRRSLAIRYIDTINRQSVCPECAWGTCNVVIRETVVALSSTYFYQILFY